MKKKITIQLLLALANFMLTSGTLWTSELNDNPTPTATTTARDFLKQRSQSAPILLSPTPKSTHAPSQFFYHKPTVLPGKNKITISPARSSDSEQQESASVTPTKIRKSVTFRDGSRDDSEDTTSPTGLTEKSLTDEFTINPDLAEFLIMHGAQSYDRTTGEKRPKRWTESPEAVKYIAEQITLGRIDLNSPEHLAIETNQNYFRNMLKKLNTELSEELATNNDPITISKIIGEIDRITKEIVSQNSTPPMVHKQRKAAIPLLRIPTSIRTIHTSHAPNTSSRTLKNEQNGNSDGNGNSDDEIAFI